MCTKSSKRAQLCGSLLLRLVQCSLLTRQVRHQPKTETYSRIRLSLPKETYSRIGLSLPKETYSRIGLEFYFDGSTLNSYNVQHKRAVFLSVQYVHLTVRAFNGTSVSHLTPLLCVKRSPEFHTRNECNFRSSPLVSGVVFTCQKQDLRVSHRQCGH